MPEALAHFAAEVWDKVKKGQARVVRWEDIKGNHPRQLKVSPVVAIRHKYCVYRSILDLSFALCLVDGGVVKSVNSTTQQLAPRGAIDQLGHSLKQIIHTFVEVADDEKILMAKWDTQDGFWRLNCQKGEEWNFCYVWPQAPGAPTQLVVPTSLQMGWVESPPYFCAASETAHGVVVEYIEMKIGTLPQHKFDEWTGASQARVNDSTLKKELRYIVKVYVDDFIRAIIPTAQEQVEHMARGLLHGIHDVFSPSNNDATDSVSIKKLRNGNGKFETKKGILGFDFDGNEKTIWLEAETRAAFLTILHHWIRGATTFNQGIPFAEFKSATAKLCHAFTALPEAYGLLSPCNWIIQKQPKVVYLHRNGELLEALRDTRTILRASIESPTMCKILWQGGPIMWGLLMHQAIVWEALLLGNYQKSHPPSFVSNGQEKSKHS